MSVIPDAPAPDPDLVTVEEFARKWRVDTSIVRGWIRRGYISYVLVGPRNMRRIRKSDIIKPLEDKVAHNGTV